MIPLDLIYQHHVVMVAPDVSLDYAAGLMCHEGVGCVLVHDQGGFLIGIATDRDIACAATGKMKMSDPISSVMNGHPVSVEPSADLELVAHLMRECGIRRIPVVERFRGNHRCIGLITLDDLIASKLVDYDQVSRIIRSQIHFGIRPRVPYAGLRRPRISERGLYGAIARCTHLGPEDVRPVTDDLLGLLTRSLHYTAAARFMVLLPRAIERRLMDQPPGPDASITPQALRERVARQLGSADHDAQVFIDAVLMTLVSELPEEEVARLRADLPFDLAALFPRSRQAAA